MSSAVDICNLGLANLGNEAIVSSIDPPDGSAEAEHCARYYPIARRVMQEHGWNFNTRRESLAALVETPVGGWAFAYSLPNLAIRVLAVYEYGETDENAVQPFVQETNSSGEEVIYTNVENATVKYAIEVTDASKFSGAFVIACGRMMSSFLAGPLIKGETGMKVALDNYKLAMAEVERAKSIDANANNLGVMQNFTPGFMSARL